MISKEGGMDYQKMTSTESSEGSLEVETLELPNLESVHSEETPRLEIPGGDEGTSTDGEAAESVPIDPTHVYCESCGHDVSFDCFWLPMPGQMPGEVVFLKIIPMMCSLCGNKVLTAPMAPLSQIQRAREMPRPNRAMRRHPGTAVGR